MNDLFGHVSVLVSIVIALGLAELVTAWGEVLRNRARVRFYWLHLFWSIFSVMLMIQMWWGIWDFNSLQDWTLAAPTALVVQSLVLVLTAQMISPKIGPSQPADMKVFYYGNARVFFIPGGLLLISMAANEVVFLDQPLVHPENMVRGAGVVLCAIAAYTKNERVHTTLAIGALTMFAFFITMGFVR